MLAAESTGLHELVDSRIAVYRFLRAALQKPSPMQHTWLMRPDFYETLELLRVRFDCPYSEVDVLPEAYDDFESRYIACFEVGLPAPPVPLLASNYNHREPVPAVIHEHVLFYKRFGLHLVRVDNEPADHLLHELAFLIHLDELVVVSSKSTESINLARRDFLQRHLTRWTPQAAADAEEKRLPSLYCVILSLLARAVGQDLELTSAAIANRMEIA